MANCPKCGYVNELHARFCINCGTKMEEKPSCEKVRCGAGNPDADVEYAPAEPSKTPGVPMDETFTVTTPVKLVQRSEISPKDKAYPKRRKKKRNRVVLLYVLGVLVIILAVAAFLIAPSATFYFDGNAAMDSGNYLDAIDCYSQANGFLDSNEKLEEAHYRYAQEYFNNGDYYNAALHYAKTVGHSDKILECGENLTNVGAYDLAREVLLLAATSESESAISFAEGMKLFTAGDYSGAMEKFNSADIYKNAEEMKHACSLMLADGYAKNGDFENALNLYKSVPDGFAYGGISASDRIATIENGSKVIALAGRWKATYIHTRTGNPFMFWYQEKLLSTVYMTIQCQMNDNGQFSVSGTVHYPILPKYDEMSENTTPVILSESFNLDNVMSVPTKISLGDKANLTLKGNDYIFYYYESDNQGNSKMTNVTFTKE